jgi:hypothetical protein
MKYWKRLALAVGLVETTVPMTVTVSPSRSGLYGSIYWILTAAIVSEITTLMTIPQW